MNVLLVHRLSPSHARSNIRDCLDEIGLECLTDILNSAVSAYEAASIRRGAIGWFTSFFQT